MIIKGSTRGHSLFDIRNLSKHLLNSTANESIEVLQIKGCASDNLFDSFKEMKAVSAGSRTSRCLYSASINVSPDEQHRMSPQFWSIAVQELEKALGMEDHQRAIIRHQKQGEDGKIREHIHIIWNRVHPETLKTAHSGWNYRTHEQVARSLERRFGLRPVVGVHSRPKGSPRPVARASHNDQQTANRTGISVQTVAELLKAAWRDTGGGEAFHRRIQQDGFRLAVGRRGIVAVDRAGTPHSLPRRLGLAAAQVQAGLSTVNSAHLPSVEEAQNTLKTTPFEKEKYMKKHRNSAKPVALAARSVNPGFAYGLKEAEEYWKSLGHTVRHDDDGLCIDLANDGRLYDYGDRMVLRRRGPPTQEDLRIMVAAAKARGWEGIHFYGGGDPEWQIRARAEAIRQGFPPESISLECEKNQKPKTPTKPAPVYPEERMPTHLLKKLGKLPTEPSPAPELEPDRGLRF